MVPAEVAVIARTRPTRALAKWIDLAMVGPFDAVTTGTPRRWQSVEFASGVARPYLIPMRRPTQHLSASLCLGTLALTLVACGPADGGNNESAGPKPGSPEWTIQNAMSAAPEAIAKDATIMDFVAGGGTSLVRQGSNGWTCYPTAPSVPYNDPKCIDGMAALWVQALGAQTKPALTSIGVGYMLHGGGTVSALDPFAPPSLSIEDWVVDPPHVMLFFPPGTLDSASLPTSRAGGGPWVMWAGTPYAHIMIPTGPAHVADTAGLKPGDRDWSIQNALSATVEAIAVRARVVGFSAGQGSEVIVLRVGESHWVCHPDTPITPTNDPECSNSVARMWEDALSPGLTPPNLTSIGFSYMLQGGSGASLGDPFVTVPPPGQEWNVGGPHLMMYLPAKLLDLAKFPSEPSVGGPWVMWGSTPHRHIMIPAR